MQFIDINHHMEIYRTFIHEYRAVPQIETQYQLYYKLKYSSQSSPISSTWTKQNQQNILCSFVN